VAAAGGSRVARRHGVPYGQFAPGFCWQNWLKAAPPPLFPLPPPAAGVVVPPPVADTPPPPPAAAGVVAAGVTAAPPPEFDDELDDEEPDEADGEVLVVSVDGVVVVSVLDELFPEPLAGML
jgi:hypothetical protein